MLRKTMTLLLSYALLSITSIAEAEQNLELAAPFTNNMILQRQTDVPVWGFDTPGAKITVEFAGQSKTAVVNQYGDWMVKLDPLEVSRAGRQMKVTNAIQYWFNLISPCLKMHLDASEKIRIYSDAMGESML